MSPEKNRDLRKPSLAVVAHRGNFCAAAEQTRRSIQEGDGSALARTTGEPEEAGVLDGVVISY